MIVGEAIPLMPLNQNMLVLCNSIHEMRSQIPNIPFDFGKIRRQAKRPQAAHRIRVTRARERGADLEVTLVGSLKRHYFVGYDSGATIDAERTAIADLLDFLS